MSATRNETAMAAREAALQMIYALEMGGQSAVEIERWYVQAHPLAPAVREQAGLLVATAAEQRERMEELIRRHARGWRLERISLIDRSLLKLALAELLLPASPPRAVVVQACLQMAKKFSQPDAVSFLHGLLDAMAGELASQATTPA